MEALIIQSQDLSSETMLERGKATIPLNGVDIPFHSRVLRKDIEHYREYLKGAIRIEDVKPDELVGRWVPNVVGKAFSLDRSYIETVQEVTGSASLGELLETMS